MSQLSYWKVLTRRKTLTNDIESETKLYRVLTTYDLTALGVGATLGVGVYVLAGHVAKDQAGPSVVISFAIAAMASLLAGLCYAEFGARVPKAGSAYIYSYVCIGEFAAFVIGWNLILEYIIGSASVCRGISLYMDTLLNDTIKNTFLEVAPIQWGFLATYFDFFAFSLAVTFGVFLSFGVQTSRLLNICCTIINIGVVIFVIIAGAIKADIKNWEINPLDVNETLYDKPLKLGDGGFFPFGFEGTLKGAATCFFGFVGFDCIATTGEEVKDPRRAIPRAILLSLLIIFLSYFGVSTVLTLMWPYYLQNVDAPLPYAFREIGFPVAQWIVTIGGMLGLVASLFGALFPLPRIIYAMSEDGLLFRFLGTVSKKFKAPVIGSICAAVLTGIISGLFDLSQLVNMMSIGTLLAYTVVAISITILRFMDNTGNSTRQSNTNENSILISTNKKEKSNCNSILMQIFNFRRLRVPSDLSTLLVCILILIYCVCCLGISLIIMHTPHEIMNAVPWTLILLGFLIAINLIIILAISVQPREEENPYFKVPLVPLIPGISIFVNIYLMLQLDIYTWIRFGIWMTIGLIMYVACFCLYSRKSNYNQNIIESYQHFNGLINHGFETDDGNIMKNNNNDCNLKISNISHNDSIESLVNEKTSPPKQSLDEIILVSEISDTMKELKQSNGNTVFIENDLSKKELDDKEKEKEDDTDTNHYYNNNDDDIVNGERNGEDEAKSVIAILDELLQDEEGSSEHNRYSRKTSIDSEMMPSFVEMSTSATIHSSSEDDCLKEEEENSCSDSLNSENKLVIKINGEQFDDDSNELDVEKEKGESKTKHENDDNLSDVSSIAAVNISMVDGIDAKSNCLEQNGSNEELPPVGILQRHFTPRNSISSLRSQKNNNHDNLSIENSNVEVSSKTIEIDDLTKDSIEEKSTQLIDNNSNTLLENVSSSKTALEIPLNEYSSVDNVTVDKTSTNQKAEIISPDSNPSLLNVRKSFMREKANITIVPLKPPASPIVRRRSSSTSSIGSQDNDPNKFENFKEKLSRLIIRPPPIKIPKKLDENIEKKSIEPKTAPAEIPMSPVKSKSEADIRQLVLNAIKDIPNNDINTTDKHDFKNHGKTIPKPPKFDPVLYKSLGAKTSNQGKERPKLNELIGNNEIDDNIRKNQIQIPSNFVLKPTITPPESEIPSQPIEPIPFREKLAALIKRGPSYRIQKQLLPVDSSPRNSLIEKEKYKNSYSEVLKAIKDAKILNQKEETDEIR